MLSSVLTPGVGLSGIHRDSYHSLPLKLHSYGPLTHNLANPKPTEATASSSIKQRMPETAKLGELLRTVKAVIPPPAHSISKRGRVDGVNWQGWVVLQASHIQI